MVGVDEYTCYTILEILKSVSHRCVPQLDQIFSMFSVQGVFFIHRCFGEEYHQVMYFMSSQYCLKSHRALLNVSPHHIYG